MDEDYARITENEATELRAAFRIDGTEGSIRATMQDEYPPSSPGRARLEVSYGDRSFEVYTSNGGTPAVRVTDADWGDTVDGWAGQEIAQEYLEDWGEVAAAVESVTGDVDVYAGTEIFKYGEDADGDSLDPRERIERSLGYEVQGSNTTRVEVRTDDPADLEGIMTAVSPELDGLVASGAISDAWDRFIEGYEQHDFGPF